MPSVIDEAIQLLVNGGLLRRREGKGCGDADIRELERLSSGPLPAAYTEFMRRLGRGCGQFMIGTDFLFPVVLELRSWAEELLRENAAPFSLSPSHYVFMMHQGYQFSYFDCAEGTDPMVLHYVEPEATTRETGLPFSSWLLRCVADCVSARGRVEELRRRRTMRWS